MRRAEGFAVFSEWRSFTLIWRHRLPMWGGYGWYQLGEQGETIRYLQGVCSSVRFDLPAAPPRRRAFFDRIDPLDFRAGAGGASRAAEMKSSSAGGW